MSGKVEVSLEALSAFAKAASGLAAEHAAPATSLPQSLLNSSAEMFYAGDNGFHEARLFADQHHRLARSVQQMLEDVIAGMESLGNGAEYCAVNYSSSDERNAAAQRQVSGETSDETLVSVKNVEEAFGPSQANGYAAPGNSAEEVLARKEAGVDWRISGSM